MQQLNVYRGERKSIMLSFCRANRLGVCPKAQLGFSGFLRAAHLRIAAKNFPAKDPGAAFTGLNLIVDRLRRRPHLL